MKFLRVLILIALVVSFMPLDAFCDEHNETTEHHHGIVVCHSYCHGAVVTNNASINLPEIQETSFKFQNGLIYESPILPTEERPPLTLLS